MNIVPNSHESAYSYAGIINSDKNSTAYQKLTVEEINLIKSSIADRVVNLLYLRTAAITRGDDCRKKRLDHEISNLKDLHSKLRDMVEC